MNTSLSSSTQSVLSGHHSTSESWEIRTFRGAGLLILLLSLLFFITPQVQAEITLSGSATGGSVDIDGDGSPDGTWTMSTTGPTSSVVTFTPGGVGFRYTRTGAWDLNSTFSVNMTDPDYIYQVSLFGHEGSFANLRSKFDSYTVNWTGASGATIFDPDTELVNQVVNANSVSFQQDNLAGSNNAQNGLTACNHNLGIRNGCLDWYVVMPSGVTSFDLVATNGADQEAFKFGLVSYADISVAKSVSASSIAEGDSGSYTVTVQNTGTAGQSAVFGLRIPDTLPAGVTFDNYSVSSDGANPAGTYNSGTGIWAIDKLALGETMTLTINFTVDAGTSGNTITNTIDPNNITMSHVDTNDNHGTLSVDFDVPAELAVSNIIDNNNGTSTVTGTVKPGATVKITDQNGVEVTCTPDPVGSDGLYSCATPVGFEFGANVTATGPGGYSSGPETVTDTTAPTVAVAAVTGNPDGTNTVTGTTEPGTTVKITDPNGVEVTCTPDPVGSDGLYSCATPVGFVFGANVTATDPSGNTSTPAPATDSTPPTAPTVTTSTGNPDGTNTVTGTSEPGTTVKITDPNGVEVTCTPDPVGSDGLYSCATPVGFVFGANVTGTDPSGNISSPTPATDTTPPAVAVSAVTGNPDGTNTVTGTTEPGTTVKITDPNGVEVTCTPDPVGSDGLYSCATPASFVFGANVTSTDPSGNVSTPATATDSTPPTAPTVTTSTGNPDGTNTVTGTSEPGTTVKITDPNGVEVTCTPDPVGSDGLYSCTTPVGFVFGANVTGTDPSGNVSSPTPATDTTPPAVAVSAVTGNPDGTNTVAGTTEPGTTVKITDPNGVEVTCTPDPVGSDGLYSCATPVGFVFGANVTSTDPSGNVSTPATATDSTPPTAPTVTTSTGNPDGTNTVTGTSEPGTTVKITDPNGVEVTCTPDPVGSDGLYSCATPVGFVFGANVTGTDPSGNVSPPTAVTDTTPPAVTVTAVTGNPDGTNTVTGTTEPGTTVKITDPNGVEVTCTPDPVGSDGLYSCATPASFVFGANVTSTDPSGNVSTPATATDSTPPTAPTVTTSTGNPDGTNTVTGTSEPGTTVKITDPNGVEVTCTPDPVGSDGLYSCTTPVGFVFGANVTGTDPSGNVSSPTPATDTTPPAVAVSAVTGNPDGTNTVAGTTEPGTTVKIIDPNGVEVTCTPDPVGSDGLYSCATPVGFVFGANVTSTDPSGNVSTPATATDSTPPTAPTVTTSTGNPDGTNTVTGTSEPGTTVKITDPNGVEVTCTPDPVGSDGLYSCTTPVGFVFGANVTGTDPSGNVSSPTPATDTTPPAVAVSAVTGNPDGTNTVTGTTEPGTTVKITDPNGVEVTCTPDPVGSDGLYSCATPVGFVFGANVTGTDPSGNVSSPAPATETTPPTVAVTAVTGNPDGTNTVTGTTEPGTTVKITDPNGVEVTCTPDPVGSDGLYSCTTPVGFVFGANVTSTDPSGNVSSPTPATDATPPAVAVSAVTGNPDGTNTVTGTTEPGTTVKITDPNGVEVTCTPDPVGSDGLYNCATPASFVFGANVTSTDPSGNVSTPATATDSTPPTAPTVTTSTGNPDGTNTVTGTSEPGTTVKITDPNGVEVTCTPDPVGSDGLYSCTTPVGFVFGANVTGTDPSGNISPATAVTDSTPPTVAVTAITGNPDGTNTVTGTAEPGTTVKITDPNGVDVTCTPDPVGSDGLYSCATPVGFVFGANVTSTDPSGNVSTPANVIDTNAPALTVDTITDNGDGTTTATGTSEPGTTVTLTDASGNTVTCSPDPVGSDGQYQCVVLVGTDLSSGNITATDPSGNTSPAVSVEDVTAPTVPALNNPSSRPGEVSSEGTSFSGTAEPGSSVAITDESGARLACTPDPVGTSGFFRCVAPLPWKGPASITTTDPSGNESSPLGPLELDDDDGMDPEDEREAMDELVDALGPNAQTSLNELGINAEEIANQPNAGALFSCNEDSCDGDTNTGDNQKGSPILVLAPDQSENPESACTQPRFVSLQGIQENARNVSTRSYGSASARTFDMGEDPDYRYPYGLIGFELACEDAADGEDTVVRLVFTQTDPSIPADAYVIRKHLAGTGRYVNLETVSVEELEKTDSLGNSSNVLVISVKIEDDSVADFIHDEDPNSMLLFDPIGPAIRTSAAFEASKKASQREIASGDLLHYTITLDALEDDDDLDSSAGLVDTLPSGFRLVSDSVRIATVDKNGNRSANAPVMAPAVFSYSGNVMSINQLSIPDDGSLEVSYMVRVGTNVTGGDYTNVARIGESVNAVNAGLLLANVATAKVTVRDDTVLNQASLIGKVFHDRDGDGYQDQGEEGIPGVRLATVNGLLIETDAHGRYHVPDVEGGRSGHGKNMILKVDPASLPEGARITTENPRVLRLTGAALNKINFGIQLPTASSPAQPQAKAASASVEVTLEDGFFQPGQTAINPKHQQALDKIEKAIRQYGGGRVLIKAGHSPALSKRRANAIRKELHSRLSNLMGHVSVEVIP